MEFVIECVCVCDTILGGLHCSPFGAALFFAHQLCVDVVRGILSAHGSAVNFCARENPGSVACLAGMGRSRPRNHPVRTIARLPW